VGEQARFQKTKRWVKRPRGGDRNQKRPEGRSDEEKIGQLLTSMIHAQVLNGGKSKHQQSVEKKRELGVFVCQIRKNWGGNFQKKERLGGEGRELGEKERPTLPKAKALHFTKNGTKHGKRRKHHHLTTWEN